MVFKISSEKITPEALCEMVDDFLRAERPRRARLLDYYHGRQGVRKGYVAQGRPNNLLTANYAKYITDVHTGYFMGLPPTLTFERRRVQERMRRALAEADLIPMLFGAARDMSICGEGYLLTYQTKKGPRLAQLSPEETFLAARGVRGEICAAVRVHSEGADRAEGELYLPGEMCEWEKQGKHLTMGAMRKLPFDTLPVTVFRNNMDGTGDFEAVTSLLDAYNLLLSGAMDDMQSVANAFLALYGVMGTTQEDVDRANHSRVLCLSENGKAEFVVKNLSPDTIALMKETLVKDLLSITMTPNLQDETFGTASGIALEYKLWGIEQSRAAKEQGFSKGIYHLISLFYQGLGQLGEEMSGACTVQFYKNLPQDVSRICENLEKLGETVSHRTRLELLPFIPDAEEELSRVAAEKKGA